MKPHITKPIPRSTGGAVRYQALPLSGAVQVAVHEHRLIHIDRGVIADYKLKVIRFNQTAMYDTYDAFPRLPLKQRSARQHSVIATQGPDFVLSDPN